MIANNEQLLNETYALVKYLYKTMPEYNKLKGTYTGIQLVLNLMGLCASITEIWSDRLQKDLENFTTDDDFHRADYLNCVKYRIDEWGKAKMNNYFLTSRFDLDIYQSNNMTFSEFANMSRTVILVMRQMAPVTRALHKLYYILKIETGMHIDYIFDSSVKSINVGDIINRMYTYRYRWNITNNYFSYKSELDFENNNIYKMFLPWSTTRAALVNVRDVYRDGSYDELLNYEVETMKNSYFNLFNLGEKLRLSGQNTFRFSLIINNSATSNIQVREYSLEIGKYVNIYTERNGIVVELLDEATSIFSDIFSTNFVSESGGNQLIGERGENLITEDSVIFDSVPNGDDINMANASLWLTSTFTMPLGTNYIYIDDSISLKFNDDELYPTINN